MTLNDSRGPAGMRRDRRPVVALGVALVLLIASVSMAVLGVLGPAPWQSGSSWGGSAGTRGVPWTSSGQYGGMMGGQAGHMGSGGHGGMMGGPYGSRMGSAPGGMMAGHVWLAGDGERVDSIAQARARAARAGTAIELEPGEVMQFTNGFYVELKDANGDPTTEVLVDPASGAVQTEYGPAMIWNTGTRTGGLSEQQAREAAAAWLGSNRSGEGVKSISAYPGYFTLDTAAGGRKVGMLSVSASTGAVWYHTWHGTFVAMEDA
jgi:hypothetical protein